LLPDRKIKFNVGMMAPRRIYVAVYPSPNNLKALTRVPYPATRNAVANGLLDLD
jgi:hypothetical protein